jgi:hypothetical protein
MVTSLYYNNLYLNSQLTHLYHLMHITEKVIPINIPSFKDVISENIS